MIIDETESNQHVQEKEILDFLYELLAIDDLEEILSKVVSEAPKLIKCEGCSIYLIPELVKECKGQLVEEGKTIRGKNVGIDFIVLAASTRRKNGVGKYFYRAGEGLTGWVFKHKQELLLDNLDKEEGLPEPNRPRWKNKYGGAEYYYDMGNKSAAKSFLCVPLITDRSKCFGVIRVSRYEHEDNRPFPNWAKETLLSFCRVISRRLELDWIIHQERLIIQDQQKSMEKLFGLGATNSSKPQVFMPIVKEAKKIIGIATCNLYMLGKEGLSVQLKATTDTIFEANRKRGKKTIFHKRGVGLVGWIFKTGKPLIINDISKFLKPINLTNKKLKEFSDSSEINDDDRNICLAKNEIKLKFHKFSHFLGVPILSLGGKPVGIIVFLGKNSERKFTDMDLQFLKQFTKNIYSLLKYRKDQKLKDTLIRIGQEYGDKLFQYVVDQMPKLVLAKGCSIFTKLDDENFKLRTTSSPYMIDGSTKKVLDIRYKAGTGKTGLVAKFGRSLIINHFGAGNLDRIRLNEQYQIYTHDDKYRKINLVDFLKDYNGNQVGLARLIRRNTDTPFSKKEEDLFDNFIKKTIYEKNKSHDGVDGGMGLPCNEATGFCEEGKPGTCRSFMAVPLKDRQENIYGVMRIPRNFPGGIFTEEDLALAESISTRLSSVLEREKVIEQNLRTLSKINTQINSSFSSDNKDLILSSILEAVTETLGFEFATIQLVDHANNTIVTKMGMKNKKIPDAIDPNNWIGAKHPLDPPDGNLDIQAWLLRKYRKEFIVNGWDPHFDKEIYDKCDHDRLIRAFIPIIAQNPEEEIGTLEAGYSVAYQDEIDEKDLMMLKALADAAAIAIRNRNLQDELIRVKLLPRVTHVLKSPLAQAIELLKATEREQNKDVPDQDRLKKYAELLKRAALETEIHFRKMAVKLPRETVTQQPEKVGIIKLLDDQCKLFQHYDRHIELHKKNLCEDCFLPLTRIERNQFEIIICNLIHNAIKWSSQGGLVKVVCCRDEDSIMINVNDLGPGIPAVNINNIWHGGLYKNADGWPEGSGQGLRDVNELVQELGWMRMVVNNEEGGARFIIGIPNNWRANP